MQQPEDDPNRFKNGFRYLFDRFVEMESEIARLNKHVVELREVIQEITLETAKRVG